MNIDIDPDVKPDQVLDLNRIPYPFKNNSVDYILAEQLLEHLTIHPLDFFKECYRILENDGVLELMMPNMFSIKRRVLYLLNRIEWASGWHPYHTKLVRPSSY